MNIFDIFAAASFEYAVYSNLAATELFDAINEWHHQHGHLGQERTWNFCKAKYWNVTQEHVKHYSLLQYLLFVS